MREKSISYGLRLCKTEVGKILIVKTAEEKASPRNVEVERQQQKELSRYQLCDDVYVQPNRSVDGCKDMWVYEWCHMCLKVWLAIKIP